MKNIKQAFFAVILMASASSQALVSDQYVSVSIGKTDYSIDPGILVYPSQTGIRVTVGGHFNKYSAIESSYTNFGSRAQGTITNGFQSGMIEFGIHGFELVFVGVLPLTDKLDLRAKLGIMHWMDENVSGGDQTYGFEFKYSVSDQFDINFEHRIYQFIDEFVTIQADNSMLGVKYHF